MYEVNTKPLGDIGQSGLAFQKSRVNIRGMLLDDDKDRMEANAATIRKNDAVIEERLAAFAANRR